MNAPVEPAVPVEGVTPEEQQIRSDSFREAVGKITEGHEQIAEARRVPEDTLQEAAEATARLYARLDEDVKVLLRYGHPVSGELRQMHEDALFAAKVAELAKTTLKALQKND